MQNHWASQNFTFYLTTLQLCVHEKRIKIAQAIPYIEYRLFITSYLQPCKCVASQEIFSYMFARDTSHMATRVAIP